MGKPRQAMKLLLTVCFAALAFASAQTCDIQTGLSCAKSVEPCIATCKTGALACAKCLASDWGACCPCIEKAIPKIPFKCPNATSRVQLEGTIAAPAHWAMAAEAPASTDLTSIYMFLNNARLAAGKPALGFLNPFIYQNAAAFNDVTSGKNNAGSGNGFTAVKGWDAATGFGTPDYTKLL